jgi:multiple sugar transport system permease protein
MTTVTATGEQTTGQRFTLKRILPVMGITFLIIFALLETVPFVLTVANSFKCLAAVQQVPQSFIPVPPFGVNCRTESGAALPADATTGALTFNPALEGYEEVARFNLPRWFGNTVIYALGVTLLRVLFDSLAGYSLARLKYPGNRAMFFIILGTMMIPGVVLLIPRFIILKQIGLLNTYQGVIFALAADAFGIFLMKQFFESIPNEIEEAAQVDGASRLRIFFQVVLPMATPALTALTVFSFQGTWNNFMDVLIIVGGNPQLQNLPLGLALLRGQFGETLRWHTFLAGSVITTLPLAVVFFIFQRYFVEGISYSGLKG